MEEKAKNAVKTFEDLAQAVADSGRPYDAVRIELGQAAGHNWFCVLFPPLCVPAAADADDGPAYPQDEQAAVHTPYKVKFAALEWWQTLWEEAYAARQYAANCTYFFGFRQR